MLIGESFQGEGEGADVAHVSTVMGPRLGPVGTAWATALVAPSAGHAPFVVGLQPGTAVKPFTLFVITSAPQTGVRGLHSDQQGAAREHVSTGLHRGPGAASTE